MTDEEIECMISLIRHFQDDGAEWTLNDVHLNTLKKKLEGMKGSPKR